MGLPVRADEHSKRLELDHKPKTEEKLSKEFYPDRWPPSAQADHARIS